MSIRNKALLEQVFEFVDRILFIEKRTTLEFKGVKLYPSEIHLILSIHRGADTNATRMAERLGLTKGAISQTLTRLEEKGVLRKVKDPYRKNELTVEFLPLGKEILDHYLRKTATLMQAYDGYFRKLSAADRDAIQQFLIHAGNVLIEHADDSG